MNDTQTNENESIIIPVASAQEIHEAQAELARLTGAPEENQLALFPEESAMSDEEFDSMIESLTEEEYANFQESITSTDYNS